MRAEFSLTAACLGGNVHVITASGDLDLAAAPDLRDALLRAWDEGATEIAVDLTKVPFVDSIGLGVLVEAAKRAKARGGLLRVVCDDRRIARIIEITGLDRVLCLHTTLRGALESLEGHPIAAVGAST